MGVIYNFTTRGNDNLDYILKCKEYEDYIDEHKNNVVNAYIEYFKNKDWTNQLPEEISIEDWNDAISDLGDIIEDHDNSKYLDDEFEPYRRYFHKTVQEKLYDQEHPEEAEIVDQEFDLAWQHHYLLNPHHSEFWLYTDIVNGALVPLDKPREDGPRDMDLLNIIHMICDWMAMSYKFENTYSPVNWYNGEGESKRRIMSTKTRHTLYLILTMIFPDEEVIE